MFAYTLIKDSGRYGFERVERPSEPLGSQDVRVAISASALNFRDIQIARGTYDEAAQQPIVPLSDAVGEVVERGGQVTRFALGDRVMTTFFPRWIDGPISASKTSATYGANSDGTLAQEIVVSQEVLVLAPKGLSDAQAATLTCAGVTAWNALFVLGAGRTGRRVLILGTGGVSVWALQLAVAAGLEPIVTSSSDAKLEIARSMGARAVVNYSTSPDWQHEVMRITQREGVELVLDVGGEQTLPRSIEATASGGKVVVIGGLSGFGGARIEPHSLIFGAKTLAGVQVGSRAMLEDLSAFVEQHRIHPIVAREFGFGDVELAYDYLASGEAFGKVVVRVR